MRHLAGFVRTHAARDALCGIRMKINSAVRAVCTFKDVSESRTQRQDIRNLEVVDNVAHALCHPAQHTFSELIMHQYRITRAPGLFPLDMTSLEPDSAS